MREGFEFVSFTNSSYGGIKKKEEEVDSSVPRYRTLSAPDCLVFVKDTIICSGKFRNNRINYLISFFPEYIDYLLQIAPYFFIHEDYLEKLEKEQPIYDITSAFDFLKSKNMIVIDDYAETITFRPLGEFEDANGILMLPNEIKRTKSNYIFSEKAKKSNQRQYDVAIDTELSKKYGMMELANTLGYRTKGELKEGYAPAPKPLIYNGKQYDFKTEKF